MAGFKDLIKSKQMLVTLYYKVSVLQYNYSFKYLVIIIKYMYWL